MTTTETIGQIATIGPYSVTLSDLGVDDYGDTPATATPSQVGRSLTGINDAQDDVDAFALDLTGAAPLQISSSDYVRVSICAGNQSPPHSTSWVAG